MSSPSRAWSLTDCAWIVLIAVIVAFVCPRGLLAQSETDGTSQTAPDFELSTLDGSTFHLEEHRGEVVVINFWATWCPPCLREIPMLVKLQRELGDQGLQIVGVALERDAGPEKVRAFAEKMDMNYPVGLGDGTVTEKYGGVRRLPMTFVVGREGNIRGRLPGRVTESRLRPGLETLLDEAS